MQSPQHIPTTPSDSQLSQQLISSFPHNSEIKYRPKSNQPTKIINVVQFQTTTLIPHPRIQQSFSQGHIFQLKPKQLQINMLNQSLIAFFFDDPQSPKQVYEQSFQKLMEKQLFQLAIEIAILD
eukprot:TRINITY_DN28371_c0_g1_i1.p3 TRINITY_DN28371_c0_g1~~TRINITY_DN28371_c0_g1_i1.p3  ORF type:complete len:124 (+),score=3.86 TRINITY_DN28371_c0_g1_i1:351-722(+)